MEQSVVPPVTVTVAPVTEQSPEATVYVTAPALEPPECDRVPVSPKDKVESSTEIDNADWSAFDNDTVTALDTAET
jgi:hypothetical protein